MSGKPKITALICALNEEDSLKHVLPRIPDWVDEVLLVDGNSTDRTVQVAKELRSDIKVLYQPGRGKGDALKHGIKNAVGDVVVTLDADGSTDPEEMCRFIEPLLNGYDFAKGSRFLKNFPRNKPWHRIIGNWIITILFDTLFLRRYTDLCSGYNGFLRKAVTSVNLWSSDGFQNEPLLNCKVAKSKLRVIEVSHSDGGRRSGYVKELAWRQGFKAINAIVKERLCR